MPSNERYVKCSKNFEKYLRAQDLLKRGTNYNTVAVIGAQSSGKSKDSLNL